MAEHYFSSKPESRSRPRRVRLAVPDGELELVTDSGVFSPDAIDLGTATLLRRAPLPGERDEVLDLGCGYGPIALALARQRPDCRVWAVDVNERALELVRRNADRYDLHNVKAILPENVPPRLAFDSIYSNPPVRIGKVRLHELLTTWLGRLQPTGRAYLVVNRHLGADSLAAWLTASGHVTSRLSSTAGYRVLAVGAGVAT